MGCLKLKNQDYFQIFKDSESTDRNLVALHFRRMHLRTSQNNSSSASKLTPMTAFCRELTAVYEYFYALLLQICVFRNVPNLLLMLQNLRCSNTVTEQRNETDSQDKISTGAPSWLPSDDDEKMLTLGEWTYAYNSTDNITYVTSTHTSDLHTNTPAPIQNHFNNYYNYRYYSPELGRWLNRDPIGELAFYVSLKYIAQKRLNKFQELRKHSLLHLYCFVNNNAIGEIDILGLIGKCWPGEPGRPPTYAGDSETTTCESWGICWCFTSICTSTWIGKVVQTDWHVPTVATRFHWVRIDPPGRTCN